MEFTGEYRIAAPREKVWEALNDPAVLKGCIDGCEELEWVGEGELLAKVRAKVGPVSARFNGTVYLKDLNPPRSYVLSGQAKGGAAGFAKGSAAIELREDGADGTVLAYTAKATVGGKLASVGARLISGVVQKNADTFFERFSSRVSAPVEAVPEAVPEAMEAEKPAVVAAVPAAAPVPESRPGRIPINARFIIIPAGWAFALLALGLIFLL